MKSRILTLFTLSLALVFTTDALGADPRNRRISVRNDTLYRGTRPITLKVLGERTLFSPGTTEEKWVKAFARLSECGATGVWFDLQGLRADGSVVDSEHVEALRTIKSQSIYRSIAPICRVFGQTHPETLDDRLRAVRTVAKTFGRDYAMIMWIDGPFAESLAAELKRLAPMLTVLATAGGDIDFIADPTQASPGRPAMLDGVLPVSGGPVQHCLFPEGEASYAAYEKGNADASERQPWSPGKHGLTDDEIAEGFVSLFDGETFGGWVITGRNKNGWAVNDGAIEFVTAGGGVVRSRDRYDDFILRIEWKLFRERGNSGIFVRAPRANRASKIGFEFQLMGDYGQEAGIHSTGSIYSVLAPLETATKPVGEWNSVEIRLEGPKYRAMLNGVVVQDVNFDEMPEMKYRLRRGFIALQDHTNKVAFRNIRLKEL